MKHLKAKLMASVGMLLVAIIMMSTASFAWFTISTSPEIANITANITANGNLEIALGVNQPAESGITDSGKNESWGNLIDLKKAFTKDGNNVVTLKPIRMSVTASDLKGTLKYPVYGLDGRIATLTELKEFTASGTDSGDFSDVTGVKFLTSTFTDYGSKKTCTNTDIYAFSVDFWLRTNTTPTDDGTAHVTLASASDRASGSDLTEDGLGSFIKGDTMNNITIAFRASSTDYVGWFLASRTDTVGTRTDIVLRKATNTNKDDLLTFDTTDTSEAFIPLKQNEAMRVTMYVYLDGDKLTNANAYLDLTAISINVQFEIDGLQDSMKVPTNEKSGRQ